jgi:FAD/FMN-containing dehydrogenase
VLDARLLPVAIELLSTSVATRLAISNEETHPILLIRYAGTPETVAFQTGETIKQLRSVDATANCVALDMDEGYWRGLAALPLQDENQLSWRANVRPTELQAFLRLAMEDGGRACPSSSLWHAGVGDGRVRVISSLPEDASQCIASLERLREGARARGGSLVVETAPPEIKKAFEVWAMSGAFVPLMQRVKNRLDPADMLSPGRFKL